MFGNSCSTYQSQTQEQNTVYKLTSLHPPTSMFLSSPWQSLKAMCLSLATLKPLIRLASDFFPLSLTQYNTALFIIVSVLPEWPAAVGLL
jgi:hypothetical protein